MLQERMTGREYLNNAGRVLFSPGKYPPVDVRLLEFWHRHSHKILAGRNGFYSRSGDVTAAKRIM